MVQKAVTKGSVEVGKSWKVAQKSIINKVFQAELCNNQKIIRFIS